MHDDSETGQFWIVERVPYRGWRVKDGRNPAAKVRVQLDATTRGNDGWSLWWVLMRLVEQSGPEPGQILIKWSEAHSYITLYYKGAPPERQGLMPPKIDWKAENPRVE